MFFNRICRSVRKLFDKIDIKEVEPKLNDVTADDFESCRQSMSEVTDEEPMTNETDDLKTSTEERVEAVSVDRLDNWVKSNGKCESKMTTDWYEIENRLNSSVNKWSNNKGFRPKPKDSNRLMEKWGESVGIFDEISGAQKRLIHLNDLNNFFVLKLSSLNCSDCLILCSLINSRYPRFYTSTVNYYQRWRMRYNIFVASDSLIYRAQSSANRTIRSTDSLNDIPTEQLVLHIGEIHLYFDVLPKYCQPVYVNSSFYANMSPINDMPGVTINSPVMVRISRIVNSIRYSKDIFQFKFPLNEDLFHQKNEIFDKFMERQTEFIDETIKVYRKNGHKNKRFSNWSQRPTKHRDYFAYDYDTKHFEAHEESLAKVEPRVSTSCSLNQTNDFEQMDWKENVSRDQFE